MIPAVTVAAILAMLKRAGRWLLDNPVAALILGLLAALGVESARGRLSRDRQDVGGLQSERQAAVG